MKTVFALEMIGDNFFAYQAAFQRGKAHHNEALERFGMRVLGPDKKPAWLARVTGREAHGIYRRAFNVVFNVDYSKANSTGSRGIYRYYVLDDGLYQVHEREKWKRTRLYLILVENCKYREVSDKEAEAWLKAKGI